MAIVETPPAETGQIIEIPENGIEINILSEDLPLTTKDIEEMKGEEGCGTEHGLCFKLKIGGLSYLFDTGASNLFSLNARRLGIGLENIVRLILSHHHFDHTGGVEQLARGTNILCHPEVFTRHSKVTLDGMNWSARLSHKEPLEAHQEAFKRLREEHRDRVKTVYNNGPLMNLEEYREMFNLILTRKPYYFPENNNIIFLGEIPRLNDFERQTTEFTDENGSPDFIMDDSALAIVTTEGLVIIAGCSHAGICNTIEYAQAITKTEKVHAIVGGFHILDSADPEVAQRTVAYLLKLKGNGTRLEPTHCVRKNFRTLLNPGKRRTTGSEITI